MEDRPRQVGLSLDGLPHGAIYSDERAAAAARPALGFTVPADTTQRLRIYAVVPGGAAQERHFTFRLTAQARPGEQPAQDAVKTEFSAPGDTD